MAKKTLALFLVCIVLLAAMVNLGEARNSKMSSKSPGTKSHVFNKSSCYKTCYETCKMEGNSSIKCLIKCKFDCVGKAS
ncbi:hypothetical protein FRX31_031122 [Thalictrum thalictroides]|uniref:Uncharacterized protein n=1 Tax=Thalictrum thalictroides TaxID=46969 RepID=A0A7J6V3E1_THATH|nr:hypothetical protein FRX31_031122 [Thalictrum thalictroides]